MKLYFFKNRYDNVVSEEAALDMTWDEVVDFFTTFEDREDKDGMLFIASEFSTTGLFKPAMRIKSNPDGSIAEESPILNELGQPAVGRYSENVKAVTAIILDSDQGWTLEEAVTQLDGIRHVGYTSFSHRKDDNGDRFRVIIPLKDPCPKVEWERRRASVRNLFPTVDGSTVALGRAFYTPATCEERKDDAFAWSSDGAVLDWREFDRLPDPPPPIPFDPKRLTTSKTAGGRVVWETCDLVQFFRDNGLYVRAVDSTKHEVACPNSSHHTKQIKAGSVVYQDRTGRPRFYCSHSHCEQFNTMFFNNYRAELVQYCSRELPLQLKLNGGK